MSLDPNYERFCVLAGELAALRESMPEGNARVSMTCALGMLRNAKAAWKKAGRRAAPARRDADYERNPCERGCPDD